MQKGILKKYRLANDAIRISAFGYDVDIPKHVGISFSEPFSYAKPNEVRLIINHLARRRTEHDHQPLVKACKIIKDEHLTQDFETLFEIFEDSVQSQTKQFA